MWKDAVADAIVPQMSDNCSLSQRSPTSATLSWSAATPAGFYTYKIYNYETDDVIASTDTHSADVTGLVGGASYTFTVTVFNGDIEGNSVTCSGVTGEWDITVILISYVYCVEHFESDEF